jgi:hypothetical protein
MGRSGSVLKEHDARSTAQARSRALRVPGHDDDGMGRTERRRALDGYVTGLLLDGERKSIEPMATRLAEDPS